MVLFENQQVWLGPSSATSVGVTVDTWLTLSEPLRFGDGDTRSRLQRGGLPHAGAAQGPPVKGELEWGGSGWEEPGNGGAPGDRPGERLASSRDGPRPSAGAQSCHYYY